MDQLKEIDRDGLYIRHAVDDAPDNKGAAFHIHDRCEVFYFVSGNAQYLVEGSVYPLKRGSLLIMRPGEAHCIRFLSDERCERYAVNFPISLFDSIDPQRRLILPFADRPLGRHNLYYLPELEDTFSELVCCEEDAYGRTLLFTLRLADIMDRLIRQTDSLPPPEPALSEKLVRYVNDMLFEDITVEQLSGHFFLSVSQFSRLFKEATGASPWAYITAKRLISAREQLQSGISAKKAAERCGFKDYSVFYRAYVKRFGEKHSGLR